jgi:tetratricopeptide (TPR) repeat protein
MVNLGFLLSRQKGRASDAESTYRQAIATNHPHHAPMAMYSLGRLLSRQEGRAGDAGRAYREAIATNTPNTHRWP